MRWVLYLEQRRLERERDEVVRGSVGRVERSYLSSSGNEVVRGSVGRFERSNLSSSGNVFARLNGIFAREMVSPVVALKAGHKISEYCS